MEENIKKGSSVPKYSIILDDGKRAMHVELYLYECCYQSINAIARAMQEASLKDKRFNAKLSIHKIRNKDND